MPVALAKATRREQKQRRQNAVLVTEPGESVDEHALLIAIVLLLLANLPAPALAERLAGLMTPFGFSPATVAALLLILGDQHTTFGAPGAGDGEAALHALQRTEAARRARYILAAARRLQSGEPTAAERRLLNAHLRAERNRREAAKRVDAAAAEHGILLGWYSKKDDRTTPDCALAHGHNFLATVPPAIGWPGTLHGGNCRCVPGPPWSQATLLP